MYCNMCDVSVITFWYTGCLWYGTLSGKGNKIIYAHLPCNTDASGICNADTNVPYFFKGSSAWYLSGTCLAVSAGSVPFIVVTLRPYFKSIPVSLDEAARIDGCNVFRSFFKIMIPTIKTGIITVVVIAFLNGWNDLIYSMTFNVKADMRPLTANIHKFQSKYGTKWNCIMHMAQF